MNIKINKEENEYMKEMLVKTQIFGSRLYGTHTKDSDHDIMCFYAPGIEWSVQMCTYPSQHQFQYDDVENNTQYVWTTLTQFWQNVYSGDSTINSDIILFSNIFKVDKLKTLRCYKVIKAYLGFAKRDLKNPKGKNKLFHAERGLYIAKCLMNNKLPSLDYIKSMKGNDNDPFFLRNMERVLREKCNKMYEHGELETYSIPDVEDPMLQKLLDSNNTKEFRYG